MSIKNNLTVVSSAIVYAPTQGQTVTLTSINVGNLRATYLASGVFGITMTDGDFDDYEFDEAACREYAEFFALLASSFTRK